MNVICMNEIQFLIYVIMTQDSFKEQQRSCDNTDPLTPTHTIHTILTQAPMVSTIFQFSHCYEFYSTLYIFFSRQILSDYTVNIFLLLFLRKDCNCWAAP